MNTKGLFLPTIALSTFLLGFSISQVFAQNQTQTSSEIFAQVSTNTLLAIIGLITAGLTLIKTLADKGIINKKIGTVAVMAADTAYAVKDSRQLIQDVVQNSHETAQLISPESAQVATQRIQPLLEKVTQRVNEFTPKVEKYNEIASKLGNKGERTTDDIKEDEELKDDIPNEIVNT